MEARDAINEVRAQAQKGEEASPKAITAALANVIERLAKSDDARTQQALRAKRGVE